MFNKEFYLKFIKNKYNHIIGGSTSIKKQVPEFRESNDIDVMMSKYFIDELLEKTNTENYKIVISTYSTNYFICSLVFNDDSKIDIIDPLGSIDAFSVKVLDGVKFLSLSKICHFKIELINNNKDINENNKHLKDLLFLINNKYVEFTDIQQIDYGKLPF